MANVKFQEVMDMETVDSTATYSTFGRHMVVDFWGVDYDLLNDEQWLKDQLVEAASRCGAMVLSVQSQQFEPQGVTVLVMLSESHISIHTYPEKQFAAVDCFTCGEAVDPKLALDLLIKMMKPTSTEGRKLVRGLGNIRVESIENTGL